MTSKQRSYLKGLAMTMEPIFQIGKSSITPEITTAIAEALEARELIKITVLKNCLDAAQSPQHWLSAPILRWFRLLEEKLSFINRRKKRRRERSSFHSFSRRNVRSY